VSDHPARTRSTPRGEQSNTLQASAEFLDSMRSAQENVSVDVIDLFDQDLPALAGDNLETKYSLLYGQPIDRGHAQSWNHIENLVRHFLSADVYLITSPMWNLTILYVLKYYIDCIVQPGLLFRYSDVGTIIPMVLGKRMVCVTSRGSSYSTEHTRWLDFQEPYLRAIFGFVGIKEIDFLNAETMDVSPSLRTNALAAACAGARRLGAQTHWSADLVASA
jgi:FMN-dependent NADH-azoreductase